MKKSLSFYYYFIMTALSLHCRYASNSPLLVGSAYAAKDEVASAMDIVIGKFTKLKGGVSVTINGSAYHGQITISEILKGNETGSLDVGFSLRSANMNAKELEPNLKDTYIMIMSSEGMISKLLPATDANIRMVKQLIAQPLK